VLIRHTVAYLPAQLIGPLTQFATAIVLTHYLGAGDYGHTMLIFAAQELVFLASISWWTFYMLRYGAAESGDPTQAPHVATRATYVATERSVLLFATIGQLIATLAIVIVVEPKASLLFFLAACIFATTRSYLNFLAEFARKHAAIGAYSLAQILPPLAGLIACVALFAFHAASPESVLIIFAAAQFAVGATVGWRLKILPKFGSCDRTILAAALAFGLPLVLAGGASWLAQHGIRVIVEMGAGAVALGLLSVGWTLATRLANVAAMVVTAAAYPLAVRAMEAGDEAGARRQLETNSALLLGVIAPATFGVFAITEPLTMLLIAPEYHAATIAILPLAMAGAAIRNLRMHGWDQILLLYEKPRSMLMVSIADGILTMIGAGGGLYFGGIVGAVLGTVIATILVTGGTLAYLRARFDLGVPIWQFIRVLIASGAMYVLLRALPGFGIAGKPEWASLALAVVIGMAAYGFALIVLFPELVRLVLAKLRARRQAA
jgi:O-antigen/teichoic acid export membrane protein